MVNYPGKRLSVNQNLVYNGDFEYSPGTTATTTNQRWVDNTAGGSTTTTQYGWATLFNGAGSGSVGFDTTSRTGTYSLKLTTDATTFQTRARSVVHTGSVTRASLISRGSRLQPNVSYTLSAWVKTNNVATNSAYIAIIQYDGAAVAGTTATSNKLSGTNDWTRVSVTFTSDSDAFAGEIFLFNFVAGNVSSAWFDDVTLTTTTPTTRRTVTRRSAGKYIGQLDSSPNLYPIHNGVTTDGTDYYGLHTSSIKKYDANWILRVQNDSAATDCGIAHIGGGQYYNGRIYLAGEDYGSPVSYSKQRISIFNANTLAFIENHDISAQDNEVSGLCIDPNAGTNGIIYVCSYVQSGAIYKYDLLDYSYLGAITLSQNLTETQDITIYNGYFYICSAQGSSQDKIFIVSPGGTVIDSFNPYMTGGAEGVDYSSGKLLVLDENSSISTSIIRTYKPIERRSTLSGNLIYNGNFTIAPPFIAETTTTSVRWIDGTAGGSAYDGGGYYGWAWAGQVNKASASFDRTVSHSGDCSLKMSVYDTGGFLGVQNSRVVNTAAALNQYAIRVNPSTSYTFTGWMKTEYISGTATNGAAFAIVERDATSAAITTHTTSYIKTTTPWTQYSIVLTTNKNTRFITFDHRIYGHQGAATLIMNAWIDDLDFRFTTPPTRDVVT